MSASERSQAPQEAVKEPDLRQVIDQGVDALLAELQHGQSERLKKYLAFSARFHRYSLSNQFLIFQQCPHASRVAGYRAWQKLGYQVAKGQKGIRILAPRTHTRKDTDSDESEEVRYFVGVAVFDASQLADLDKKPLPAFFTPLADDQGALFGRLVHVVEEAGISVDLSEHTGSAQGISQGGRVALKVGLDSTSRVLTLLHEYAHELLHWSAQGIKQPVNVKECHAEAVSYVVAQHFGIHNPFTADYLQSWGTTAPELMGELEVVRRTAAHIIERIAHRPDQAVGPMPAEQGAQDRMVGEGEGRSGRQRLLPQ